MPEIQNDIDTLSLIIEKERAYSTEIRRLSMRMRSDDLTDYLNGLNDLKLDHLTPLRRELEDALSARNVFSDRYRYFDRT